MNRIILGINCGYDSTASLLVDDNVLAVVAEEGLSGEKKHLGFPWKAIQEVLKISGIAPESVNIVVIPNIAYMNAHPFFINLIMRENRTCLDISNEFEIVSLMRELFFQIKEGGNFSPQFSRIIDGDYARNVFKKKLRSLGITASLEPIENQLAHAASAYYTSGFKDCTVFTFDGSGDGLSHTTSVPKNLILKRIAWTDEIFSPGVFYSSIAKHLGFNRIYQEENIMGLAKNGDPSRLYSFFSDIFCVAEDGFSFSSKIKYHFSLTKKIMIFFKIFSGNYFRSHRTNFLLELYRKYLIREKPEDIAAAAQKVFEDVTVSLVENTIRKTGFRKVALAGKVCANIKLNQKIMEIEGVEEVYIHPDPGDGGSAIGGTLAYIARENENTGSYLKPKRIEHINWGPEFSNDEIKFEINKLGLEAKYFHDIESETASLIAKGYIVGRFNGRMEYGRNSLGNRSILTEATGKNASQKVNARFKKDALMPFVSSILEEYATDYYEEINKFQYTGEFASISGKLRAVHRQKFPSVIDIDGSARPHIVRKLSNPSFYRVLASYMERTGFPIILNITFNNHNGTIVYAPKDAMRSFSSGCLDVLSIGNFILKQPGLQNIYSNKN
jgi:carbamoyltransferase